MNRIVLLHSLDPRGTKVGGIETHVRQVMARHPASTRLLLVGIDGRGDLTLGQPVEIEVAGRTLDFLPILHEPEDTMRLPAKKLWRSLTLRFALASLRYLPTLRRLAHDRPASAEIQRSEFILTAKLAGLKTVMLVHNEFTHKDKMDSLLKRYWWLFRWTERVSIALADWIYGVNPSIVARLQADYPASAARMGMLTVSVDTDVFRPASFTLPDDVLRLVFAGRLDGFKDPELMFDVAARLHTALNGQFEFHYAGGSDPERFENFAKIRSFTVLHGVQDQNRITRLLHQAHMGILTSYFEGMPCFLLELLASGRPFVGLHLPQFDLVVRPDLSGEMVERLPDRQKTAEQITQKALKLWDAIRQNHCDPQQIHDCVLPFSIHQQLGQLFERHQRLSADTPSSATRSDEP